MPLTKLEFSPPTTESLSLGIKRPFTTKTQGHFVSLWNSLHKAIFSREIKTISKPEPNTTNNKSGKPWYT